ncbi:hypothetical protein L7F22_045607 [Adiantum nelumboides]|nr:hypothetical protein [Adiantum nelumboides]
MDDDDSYVHLAFISYIDDIPDEILPEFSPAPEIIIIPDSPEPEFIPEPESLPVPEPIPVPEPEPISIAEPEQVAPDRDFAEFFRVLKLATPTQVEMNLFAAYTIQNDLIYYEDRICMPHNSHMRKMLLQEHHEVPYGAHPGINKTYKILTAVYYWPQMKQDVVNYVKACHSCQTMKTSRQLPQGLLQPLPILNERWESISMDFIVTLPKSSKSNTQILVTTDRFSKMVYFISCRITTSAPDIASLFIQHNFRIHGLPKSIVSNRDPKFTGHFWTSLFKSLFKSLGTNLLFSSAYHPQTDGQTERVNQTLEEMLRHYIQIRLNTWEEYLPLVEFAYNNSFHTTIGMTPFQAAFGHTPLVPTNFVIQHKVALANQLVNEMQDLLLQIKDKLAHVRQTYQKQANKHRRHFDFQDGD